MSYAFHQKQSLSWAGLMFVLFAAGCRGSVDQRDTRVRALGAGTLNGDPLNYVTVIFESDQGAGKVRSSAPGSDGRFKFAKRRGRLRGTAHVQVIPVDIELAELEAVRGGRLSVSVHPFKDQIPHRHKIRS